MRRIDDGVISLDRGLPICRRPSALCTYYVYDQTTEQQSGFGGDVLEDVAVWILEELECNRQVVVF